MYKQDQQYKSPVLILPEGDTQQLDKLPLKQSDGKVVIDEKTLQGFIHDHPSSLPINEIEDAFTPLYPVCRELKTPVGYLDNLFISESGKLTLVECKLWRNPEALRKVVGQILDYAKEFSRWNYTELNAAINAAINDGPKDNRLFEIVSSQTENITEADFTDAVSRNLRRGRFLLLIVGDGIRENVVQMVDYLQRHAGLGFTFGLVEYALFQLPEGKGLLAQPRVVAKTEIIERAVVRLESDEIVMEESSSPTNCRVPRRPTTITEQDFFESIEKVDPTLPERLQAFLDKLEELNVIPDFQKTLNMKWDYSGKEMNFGQIQQNNGNVEVLFEVANRLFVKTDKLDLAKFYQSCLTKIIPDAQFMEHHNPDYQTVKLSSGERPSLTQLLDIDIQDEWLKLIQKTQDKIKEAFKDTD